jgi:hypothetical protein
MSAHLATVERFKVMLMAVLLAPLKSESGTT